MSFTNSQILKAITGVLLIEKDGDEKLVCIEDLGNSKHFSIGSLFNAIRVLNNKNIDQYGSKWVRCAVGTDNPSNDWLAIVQNHKNADSDLEFLRDVCIQLGEEMPEVVSKPVVQKKIDEYRAGTLYIA